MSLVNPKKTGNDMHEWRLFNMTGVYAKGLQFWKYSPNGVGNGPVMTLGDNGFVGIGLPTNVSPAHRVHIKDGHFYAEEGALYSQYSNNEGGRIVLRNPNKMGGIANEWVLFNMTSTYGTPSLQFWRYFQSGGGGMVMTLADNGNVGIGTSNPAHKLVVEGNIATNNGNFYQYGGGTMYTGSGGMWANGPIYAGQDITTTYVKVNASGNGSNLCTASQVGWIRYDDVNAKFQGCARDQWGGYVWHNFN